MTFSICVWFDSFVSFPEPIELHVRIWIFDSQEFDQLEENAAEPCNPILKTFDLVCTWYFDVRLDSSESFTEISMD